MQNIIHIALIIVLMANQAAFSFLETRQSSNSVIPESQTTTQSSTPTPENTPTNSAYPPPEQPQPTPTITITQPTATATATQAPITPTPAPTSTVPVETGENPIEIQLSSGTPILLVGQELVLAWQIKTDKQEIETESFQISIQAPNFATPKDESLSADGNGSFILQPLDMSGDIAWDLPLEINGPVSFQITLLQNEKPVSQSSMTIYTGGTPV